MLHRPYLLAYATRRDSQEQPAMSLVQEPPSHVNSPQTYYVLVINISLHSQNLSIRFRRTVHIRALLPYMYIGTVVAKQASWIPPMATKVFFDPSASSQRLKKSEKTRPWKMSSGCCQYLAVGLRKECSNYFSKSLV